MKNNLPNLEIIRFLLVTQRICPYSLRLLLCLFSSFLTEDKILLLVLNGELLLIKSLLPIPWLGVHPKIRKYSVYTNSTYGVSFEL